MDQVLLCEPLRTAIGTYGGSLKDVSAVELGTNIVKNIPIKFLLNILLNIKIS